MKLVSWDQAVALLGEAEATKKATAGLVSPPPEVKRYGDHYPFYQAARKAVEPINNNMRDKGLPGYFRIQLAGMPGKEDGGKKKGSPKKK